MKYAPILIPTLCRYEHFVRCIESLKKNSWAKYTDIFIALDYPAKESHFDGYNKICEYLKGDFLDFASFNIIKRPYNFGVEENMKQLMGIALEKYDRFIRTDDDAEFSPNFIEYMDKCLDYYEDDKDVVAINGYSYPLLWKHQKDCNTIKSNFICTMWGIGFWNEKYKAISEKLRSGYLTKAFEICNRHKVFKKMTTAKSLSFISAGLDFDKGLLWKGSDIAWSTFLGVENKFVILPTISKVRNWGFDGTGEYCQNTHNLSKRKISAFNYEYENQKIDDSDHFSLKPDNSTDCNYNKDLLNKFDFRPLAYIYKAKLKLLVYSILGKKLYIKLRNKIHGTKKQSY